MRGLFSPAPGQPAIRVMVGAHLLLLVQSWLVFSSGDGVAGMLRVMVGMTATLGLLAFAFAVHGGTGEDDEVWPPRRMTHDRHVRGRL